MRVPGTVLIIGAGLAGLRCAETLRAEGFAGRVILVGDEASPPYERPALSKELLSGEREPRDLLLRPDSFWQEREIDLRLGVRISVVDPLARVAIATSGQRFDWNALVIATGAQARRPGGFEIRRGVYVLRSLADALELRAELRPGRRLAVVGGGFVGTEVASTARTLGVDVVLIEAGPAPLARALGQEVGEALAARYRAHGVDVRLGARVAAFRPGPGGRVREVGIQGAAGVACDAALVALGAVPAVPRGVPAEADVATDASGRATLPDIYACGDVACTWRPSLAARLRVEHWTSAASQGAAVAHAILGRDAPSDDLPYFWSDQFGLRLQHVGRPDGWASVELEGDDDCFAARYRATDGRLLGALLANRSPEVAALRRELAAQPLAA